MVLGRGRPRVAEALTAVRAPHRRWRGDDKLVGEGPSSVLLVPMVTSSEVVVVGAILDAFTPRSLAPIVQ
jgi:hypothetical protein